MLCVQEHIIIYNRGQSCFALTIQALILLMYLEFFGMRELPFTLTPNTDLYIDMDGHHQALEAILLALEGGEGFIKITGEVGTGKTLLCRRLLDSLGDEMVTACIPNPFLTPDGLLLALAEELELPVTEESGSYHILRQIKDHLMTLNKAGKHVVFLLDEAQSMPEESIETLRLLNNLETESEKLLQIVLFGQPELNELLNRNSLRQLKQRITLNYTLPVLNSEEVGSYITHRLTKAGYTGVALFNGDAIQAVALASGGIPRLVNILCHKALLVAYSRCDHRIRAEHVNRAIEDTEDTRTEVQTALLSAPGYNRSTLILSCFAASVVTFLLVWILVL